MFDSQSTPTVELKEGLPPGLPWPALVQTLFWVFRPVQMLRIARKRYGDTFSAHLLGLGRIVMTADPEEIRRVFAAPADRLHAGEANMVLSPIVGQHSVLVLDEERHMRQRKLLLPPFHGERMRAWVDEMESITDEAIDTWPRGEAFKLRDQTQAITMDIILRVVFGITDHARRREFRDRMNALEPNIWFRKFALAPLIQKIPRMERRMFDDFRRAKADFDALMLEELNDRRAQPDAAERGDVLSLLLQAADDEGAPMTDDELRDELVTLVVAGHETTATALAWTFELMLRRPEVWERVREEAEAGESAYVDAVIKESLRMRPILPLVARVIKEPIEIAGYRLRPGNTVTPSIYLSHYREANYPDAESFIPERFIEGQPEGSTWLPFGGGIRRCIGASFALYEMRVVIQTIARRTDIRLTRDVEEPIVRRAITFAPGNDVPVAIDNVKPARTREPAPAMGSS
ncbi:MAG: cytochrome P450 [Actinobacteria bacterium]|nr:cytochrome P450 [Actinomycetota bacterium]